MFVEDAAIGYSDPVGSSGEKSQTLSSIPTSALDVLGLSPQNQDIPIDSEEVRGADNPRLLREFAEVIEPTFRQVIPGYPVGLSPEALRTAVFVYGVRRKALNSRETVSDLGGQIRKEFGAIAPDAKPLLACLSKLMDTKQPEANPRLRR